MFDVLYINGCDLEHPTRYRVYHPIEQLKNFGVNCNVVHYTKLTLDDEKTANKFIFYRCPYTEVVGNFIKLAHDHNKIVYFDTDDLVIDTKYTDKLPFRKNFSDEERQLFDDGVNRIGQTLKLCDVGIGSTTCLANEMQHYVKRTFVNKNVASKEMFNISEDEYNNNIERKDDKILLGYFSGTSTHDSDFAIIEKPLIEILKNNNNVNLFVSKLTVLPESFRKFENQIITFDQVDWKDLPKLIGKVDINLVPLENNIFNKAKSENKYVDASLVGVPTIASNVGPFAEAIVHLDNGMLCSDDDSWIEALNKLIQDCELRKNIGCKAHDFCVNNYVACNTGYALATEILGKKLSISDFLKISSEENQINNFLSSRGYDIADSDNSNKDNNLDFERRIEFLRQSKAKNKNNCVLIYEDTCGDDATFRYFGINFVNAMKLSLNWDVEYFYVKEIDRLKEFISLIDCVILLRMRQRPEVHDFVNYSHKHKIPVAYMIDDKCLGDSCVEDLYRVLHLDEDNDFERNFWQGVARRFEFQANECDCLIAPVKYLSSYFEKAYNKPAFVLHSTTNQKQEDIAQEIFNSRAPNKKDINKDFVFAYFSGTSSHDSDFALIEDDVVQFLNKHNDAKLLLGGKLEISEKIYPLIKSKKIILLPFVDYATLQYLQAAVDVVLAPLVKNDFSNSKSALKVYEAGLVETPSLASNVFAYEEAIDNNKSGIICKKKGDWFSALSKLYNDKSLCISMGKEARSIVLKKYSLDSMKIEAEQLLDELLKVNCCISHYTNTKIMNYVASQHLNWDDQLQINKYYSDSYIDDIFSDKANTYIIDNPKRIIKRQLGSFIHTTRKMGMFEGLKVITMFPLQKISTKLPKVSKLKNLPNKFKNKIENIQNPQKINFVDVLFVNGCDFSLPHPIRYRIDHQVEQLESCGIRCLILNTWELEMKHAGFARSIIIYRAPYTDELGDFIRLAKSLNKKVYFDIDDLVIDTKYTDTIPTVMDMSKEEKALYDDGVYRYGKTLIECGSAITTTTRLKKELEKYVNHVFINRNVASMQMLKYSQEALAKDNKNKETITLGYFSGSITHNDDFNMILPDIVRILKENNNVRLLLVGKVDLPQELLEYKQQIIIKDFVDWKSLPALIAFADINLVPLRETIFNEAKSENKWTEAALVKVPTIATNFGPFKEIIEDGNTGILTTNDKWYDKLNELIKNDDKRQKIGENAYNFVINNYTTLSTGTKISKFITNQRNKNYMFVLPAIDNTGGVMVAIKHAMILQDAGYDVMIADNGQTSASDLLRVEGHVFPIKFVYSLINSGNRHLMYGKIDNVIATIWFTLGIKHLIYNYDKFFYLVQGYEAGFYGTASDNQLGAFTSYHADNVCYITISKWCQNWLKDKFDVKANYAPNGIDTKLFFYKERNFNESKIKILVEGDCTSETKNIDEAFKITNSLDRSKFEVWYLSYGGQAKDWYEVDKSFNKVPHEEVYKIYQNCHILLKTSLLESFSYPPLEMMATGGYVVAIPNEGNIEYLKNGYNCLFFKKGDINQPIDCINNIINDASLRNSLNDGAKETVQSRDWRAINDSIINLYS